MANSTNYLNFNDSVTSISDENVNGSGTGVITYDYLQWLGNYIFTVSNPIITVVSVLANVLTLIVMSRRSLRRSTVAVHLSAMSISDSLVLVMDTLNNWFNTVININLLGLSDGFCKFHRFFFNVVYTYSAWIVTSVCIERFIVVWFPFRAKQLCSYRNSVVTVLVMPVPICAIYLYNLWAWHANGSGCLIVSNWNVFQSDIGPWISGFAYSYCPVIVMVILNAAIIGKLSLARRSRRQMSIDASNHEKRESRITVTIVVICIFYVIMTVPLGIYYILAFKYGEVRYRVASKIGRCLVRLDKLFIYAFRERYRTSIQLFPIALLSLS